MPKYLKLLGKGHISCALNSLKSTESNSMLSYAPQVHYKYFLILSTVSIIFMI